MDRDELRDRTKRFALRIIKLVAALPKKTEGYVLGRQLLKSGTSIGANYREALRASSRKHFISTTEIALREADETLYWLELLADSEIVKPSRITDLTDEDHVGCLSQGVFQSGLERNRVVANLPLGDDTLLVAMEKFNRILNRDDMTRRRGVPIIDHGGQRTGLTAAC